MTTCPKLIFIFDFHWICHNVLFEWKKYTNHFWWYRMYFLILSNVSPCLTTFSILFFSFSCNTGHQMIRFVGLNIYLLCFAIVFVCKFTVFIFFPETIWVEESQIITKLFIQNSSCLFQPIYGVTKVVAQTRKH